MAPRFYALFMALAFTLQTKTSSAVNSTDLRPSSQQGIARGMKFFRILQELGVTENLEGGVDSQDSFLFSANYFLNSERCLQPFLSWKLPSPKYWFGHSLRGIGSKFNAAAQLELIEAYRHDCGRSRLSPSTWRIFVYEDKLEEIEGHKGSESKYGEAGTISIQ